MYQESVRLVVRLAVLPQRLAYSLTLLPGVGEHQTFSAFCVLKDVANAGVSCFWRSVRRLLYRCKVPGHIVVIRVIIKISCLRERVEEVFHRKTPYLFFSVKFWYYRLSAAPGGKESPGGFRFSDRCGEADPSWVALRQAAESLNKAEGLTAAVSSEERMDLVYHDEPQVREHRRDLHVLVDQERFK